MRNMKKERRINTQKIANECKQPLRKLDKFNDVFVYCLEQNPGCTKWELGRGILRGLGLTSIASNDLAVSQQMVQWKQKINKDPRDEHIIGVEHTFTEVPTCKQKRVIYLDIAYSKDAIEAAK